jgi:glucose-1-phosphate cytidylyltransferase
LFCGGLGTRLREHSDVFPEPPVNAGSRPIVWHLIRYYAHYGYKEFIVAMGCRGEMMRESFLKYDECMPNDFVLSQGGRNIDLLNNDIDGWRITFVDTGLHSNLGERLRRVRKYVEGDEEILANNSDDVSNLPLERHMEQFRRLKAIASFATVPLPQSIKAVHGDEGSLATSFGRVRDSCL